MIVGITGTNGAGKGTVVDFLVRQKGFKHYSVRGFLIEELTRRNLPLERPNMRELANELREKHGASFVVEELLSRAQTASGGDSVIESIRAVGEAEFLKAHHALLWAVDADRKTRYERVLLRQSETDRVSFEQFCEYEEKEMHNTDPAKQNIAAVMALADHIFYNDATMEGLFAQVENVLAGQGQ